MNHKSIFNAGLDETMLLKAESDNVTTFTPKLLKLNKVTIPQEFIIRDTRPPRNIGSKQCSTNNRSDRR